MKFEIPNEMKALKSHGFDLLLPVELNDTDVDKLLTQVMERGIKQNRVSPSKADPLGYQRHLEMLQNSSGVTGFHGERGRRVLDGWLRTSVLKMAKIGQKRQGEQMDYIRPLTAAAYRSGLPKTRSSRRIDAVVIRAMLEELESNGAELPAKELGKLFKTALGAGLAIDENLLPSFDGHTELDATELLALRFIETFAGNQNSSGDAVARVESVPGAVLPIGRDLVDLLKVHGPFWAPAEVAASMAALIALRMFQLPLRIGRATAQVLALGEAPDVSARDADNPCEMYCDFTRRRGSASDDLARACVARDLEILRNSFSHRLLLRSVLQASELTSHAGIAKLPPPERLRALGTLVSDPEIGMALRMQLQAIEQVLTADPSQASADSLEFLRQVLDTNISRAEQMKMVLVEGLHKRGLENAVKWFWRTGGLTRAGANKPYALLDGALQARTSWRYAPTDEMLAAMLTMCFIENGRTVARLPLADLLVRLEQRFGILVSRPPAALDTPESRAGAADNLNAFRRQLQLLGCFEGLSDDFTAQFVTSPHGANS